MNPARSAAQNGWIKAFALIRATARRKIAPAPALANITAAGRKRSMPKMTDNATAQAAAASANSQVGAGADLVIAGLNLAIFSLNQLRLQIEADGGNGDAARVLDLRKNSNQILATVIWGNVGTNVLLTLFSDLAAFFSAVVITLFGEIVPQAYFSRNALRMTARFLPFLIFWRAALFVLAKPTAILLDWWLGVEGISYLRERDVRSLVTRAAVSGGDIGTLEAIGVQNFLDLDDLRMSEEGEIVHSDSIISLPLESGRCRLPAFTPSPDDPFLRKVNASGKKWVIVTDLAGEPAFVLDPHQFLRDALFDRPTATFPACWHRPVIIRDPQTKLGDVIGSLRVVQERPDDDVIDDDLILLWGTQKRIITGSGPSGPAAARHRQRGERQSICCSSSRRGAR